MFPAALALRGQDGERVTTVETAYASRAVERGVVRATDHAKLAVATTGDAWSVGAWWREPLPGGEPREAGAEVAARWRSAEETSAVRAGLRHRRYAAWRGGGAPEQSSEVFVDFSRPSGRLPGWEFAAAYDFAFEAFVFEAALRGEIALKRLGAFLEWRAHVGQNRARDLRPAAAGSARSDAYTYAGAEIRLPYRIGVHTTVTVSAGLSGARGQSGFWSPIRRPGGVGGWGGLGLTFDF
jgi:hypothetical protein